MSDKEPSPEIQTFLRSVANHFDKEERAVRDRQILQWRKLKLYWNGYQRVWLDSVAHDWRTWDQTNLAQSSQDSAYYDKPINVFQAYLQSIIAALSVRVPGVICYPDDAENPLDLDTAKAGNKVFELVSRHVNAEMLWLQALYIMSTEGLIAAYNYSKSDEKYGTYEVNKYENVTEDHFQCPECGSEIDQAFTDREISEFQPDNDDVELHDQLINKGELTCPQCAVALDPELQKSPMIVEKLVSTDNIPKARQCIELFGGLFIKVPNWAKCQADCTYLTLCYETHYANVLEEFPHLRDKITSSSGSYYDSYEKWARLSTQYNGDFPVNTVTMRYTWLRPAAFNILPEDEAKELKKKYPDGCKVIFANDHFAHACNESLDDHWTLSQNPLSDYIHYEPLGKALTNGQDIINDLISLTLQTIEHGISQTFADPAVLNFDQYSQTETTPGMIFPVTARSGKALGESFFELKTANLGQEVMPFAEKINELNQFASGALPSIFGGASSGGSQTAAEYSMSRAQAQQRLQNTWKILNRFWKEIWCKVIPQYIKDIADDERDVKQTPDGRFENVLIRKAELSGKLGRIELDSSDEIPITASQQRDVVMQFLQAGNQEIVEAIMAPENLQFVAQLIGIPSLKLPGMDDRQRQFAEIQGLIQTAPIPNPNADPMNPMSQSLPSVDIEPLVDEHNIHVDICKAWLRSDAGQLTKVENPNGYQNVLLHLNEHMRFISLTTMPEDNGASSNKPEGGPQNDKVMAPKKNERNNGVRPSN